MTPEGPPQCTHRNSWYGSNLIFAPGALMNPCNRREHELPRVKVASPLPMCIVRLARVAEEQHSIHAGLSIHEEDVKYKP